MSVQSVLGELRSQGIDLIVKNGKLLSKPSIPEQLLQQTRQYKHQLIEVLLVERGDAPTDEDEFIEHLGQAIHKISNYWQGIIPEPSAQLEDEIAQVEDSLNQAVAREKSRASFEELVDRYVELWTISLAEQ